MASTSAVSSTCHGRAPCAAQERRPRPRRRRRPAASQASRRTVSGESRFSTGIRCSSATAPTAARAAASRAAAAGSRSPHDRAGGGPSCARLRLRAGRLVGQREGRGDGRQPGRGLPAHRAPAPDGQRDQVLLGARRRQRGRDDRRVGQHPAGGDVAPPGHLVAALPQRAHHGELAALAHPVHARGPPPGVDPRRRRAARRRSPRTPARPTRACPARRAGRRARRAARRAPRRRAPRSAATAPAAAGSTSRPPSGPSPG